MPDEKAPTNINYHSGFISGLELLLWPYREKIEIIPEKWLSTQGIRMDDDIRLFKEMAFISRETTYIKMVDDIFQVSVSANKETYARLMREDPNMCEALRELMKDDFLATEARGEARGVSLGDRRRMERDAKGMYAKGLKPADIAEIQGVPVETVEQILGLELV